MAKQQAAARPEREEDCDYSWESLKASTQEISRKSKLIAKNLPTELADAADDYICAKAEEVKESITERVNRMRDRIKRRLVLRALCSIDFGMKIAIFPIFKLKLDRLRRKFERLNDENALVQLRSDIEKRLVRVHNVPDGNDKSEFGAQGF